MITPPTAPSPGKPVSASFFSRLIAWVKSGQLIDGAGYRLRRTPNGTSIQFDKSVDSQAQAQVKPFDIRYVKEDLERGIPRSEFQIYIPDGCVSCGSTCKSLNSNAYRGNDDYIDTLPGWYSIKVSESYNEPRIAYVNLHIKGPSGIDGIDRLEDLPKRYFYVEGDSGDRNRESKYSHGDELVIRLGYFNDLEMSYLGEVYSWSYKKAFDTPVIVNSNSATLQFALCHIFRDERLYQSKYYEHRRTFVINPYWSAGGVPYKIDSMIEIPTNAKGVYLKIDCSVSPFTARVVTYENDQAAESEKGQFEIIIPLYSLENGRVKADRRQSLSNILVYQ